MIGGDHNVRRNAGEHLHLVIASGSQLDHGNTRAAILYEVELRRMVVGSVMMADLGTNIPMLLPGSKMRAVPNMPGLRAISLLGNSASTVKVREPESIAGLIAVIRPRKLRPG